MVDIDSAADKPLPYLGAWSPEGRRPRPCDLPADRLVQYRKKRQFWTLVVAWTVIVVFLSFFFARDLLGAVSRETLLTLLIALVLPFALIEGYRRYCWVAQRLHDMGQSSWPYLMRLLSVVVILIVIIVVTLAILRNPAPETGAPAFFGVAYITLLIPGGFLLLIAILWG